MCHVVELAQGRLNHVLWRRVLEMLHHVVAPLVVSVEWWVWYTAATVAWLKQVLCLFLQSVAEEPWVTDIGWVNCGAILSYADNRRPLTAYSWRLSTFIGHPSVLSVDLGPYLCLNLLAKTLVVFIILILKLSFLELSNRNDSCIV